jgi:hypothetical protein
MEETDLAARYGRRGDDMRHSSLRDAALVAKRCGTRRDDMRYSME